MSVFVYEDVMITGSLLLFRKIKMLAEQTLVLTLFGMFQICQALSVQNKILSDVGLQ